MTANDAGQVYEDPTILDEYLLFHYGGAGEILSDDVSWPAGMADALDFAKRTPSHFSGDRVARGLDLGCAVGRSTFEMARNCEQVIGLDFSHGFVAAADQLSKEGRVNYTRRDEGNLTTELVAEIPEDLDPSRVTFIQGDAMNLPEELEDFDRVHAANLLCRLKEPERLLHRLPSLVRSGGELVLATPCTWLENFTPRGNWPAADTFGWLQKMLSGTFDLRFKGDEPFLIRETARKFQWTRSMLTVWTRR